MRFRAVTHDYKLVYFGVEDAPVAINDKSSILVNRKNSPMILSKSIVRGTDDGIFESDFVTWEDNMTLVGFVVYRDGFYVWDYKRDNLIPLRDRSKFVFTENTRLYRIDDINKMKSPIKFYGGNRVFRLNRIMYSKDNNLFVEVRNCKGGVNINEVKLCTGLEFDHTELYYGQHIGDGVVEFHNYHPMIKTLSGEYREVEDTDYVDVCTSGDYDG